MFIKVVKTAFQQRRKTMRNSLKVFNLSDKLKEDTIFGQRPEQLSVSQFITLTQKLEKTMQFQLTADYIEKVAKLNC